MNFINGIFDMVLYLISIIPIFYPFVYLVLSCLVLCLLARIFKKFTQL